MAQRSAVAAALRAAVVGVVVALCVLRIERASAQQTLSDGVAVTATRALKAFAFAPYAATARVSVGVWSDMTGANLTVVVQDVYPLSPRPEHVLARGDGAAVLLGLRGDLQPERTYYIYVDGLHSDAEEYTVVAQTTAVHSRLDQPGPLLSFALPGFCKAVQLDDMPTSLNATLEVVASANVSVYASATYPYPDSANTSDWSGGVDVAGGAAYFSFFVPYCDSPYFVSVCADEPAIFTLELSVQALLFTGGVSFSYQVCEAAPLYFDAYVTETQNTFVALMPRNTSSLLDMFALPSGWPFVGNYTWKSSTIVNSSAVLLSFYDTDPLVTPPQEVVGAFVSGVRTFVDGVVQVTTTPVIIAVDSVSYFMATALWHQFFAVTLSELVVAKPARVVVSVRTPIGPLSPMIYLAGAVSNLYPTVTKNDHVDSALGAVQLQYLQELGDCSVLSFNVAVFTTIDTQFEIRVSEMRALFQPNVSSTLGVCASFFNFISLNTSTDSRGWELRTDCEFCELYLSDVTTSPGPLPANTSGVQTVSIVTDSPVVYVGVLSNTTGQITFQFFAVPSCLHDCNRHGQCVDGVCVCESGYQLPDCRATFGIGLVPAIAASVTVVGVGIIAVVLFCIIRRRRRQTEERRPLISRTGVSVSLMNADWRISYGELTLTRRIGAGNFGEVFIARWHGATVAVKQLFVHASSEIETIFTSEVALMSRMRHPNVVQFLGACVPPPAYCIVTEYVPRGNLSSILSDASIVLDWTRLMAMLRDIARGMAYLHGLNIVHRDVKPANLLVDEHWNIKIADFGLARAKRNSGTMTHVGTPQYAAPEVLRHERYGTEADVYSFGIITWELLTRQTPFSDMHALAAGMAVAFKNLRPPIPPTCPAALVSLMTSCWHDGPSKRPSFEAVLTQLDAFAPPKNVPLPLRLTSLSTPPIRWNEGGGRSPRVRGRALEAEGALRDAASPAAGAPAARERLAPPAAAAAATSSESSRLDSESERDSTGE